MSEITPPRASAGVEECCRYVARLHDERECESGQEDKQLHETTEDRPSCAQSPNRDWPLLLCLLLLLLLSTLLLAPCATLVVRRTALWPLAQRPNQPARLMFAVAVAVAAA